MTKSKKNLSKKSVTGFVLASLFALSTTLSTHATLVAGSQSASGGTISPFIKVVDERLPSELVIVFSDADVIAANNVALQTDRGSEQYILAGEYQACVISNSMEADATHSTNAGILMKVTKDPDNAGHYAAANTGGVDQLALYSTATNGGNNKIRFMLHVTPSGMTKLSNTFGAGSAVQNNSYNQLAATPFMIGGAGASGANLDVYLNDANATTHATTKTTLENLALGDWGTVNHFGMNPGIGTHADDQTTVANGTSTTGGIAATEGLTITNCSADQDPSSTDTLVADKGLITIKIYVNANDLSQSVAGSYSTSYQLSFADVDDISTGVEDNS
jgi:hypothetical protein